MQKKTKKNLTSICKTVCDSKILVELDNDESTFNIKTSSNHRLKKCVRVLVGWKSNF